MANHATLPAGWFLECTTAGISGSGTLTITTPTVGGTVSDGTVTWTIRKQASTQDLTGYLPLSGGAMTGDIIARADDNYKLELRGGSNELKGGLLQLYGVDNADTVHQGFFGLGAVNSGGIAKWLEGLNNGTLTWNGNSLDKSAVVAESLGTTGYRKYASGLVVQWGQTVAYTSNTMITLPISFSSTNFTVVVGVLRTNQEITNPNAIYYDERTKSSFYARASETTYITYLAHGY